MKLFLARDPEVEEEEAEAVASRPVGSIGYFGWSRDPAVALLGVLPLWVLYEILRLTLAPEERNGAESLVTSSIQFFGSNALAVLRIVLLAVVIVAALSVLRRRLPWARLAAVSALEGAIYGLMLGPVTSVVSLFVLEGTALAMPAVQAADIVGSLGAGIFEEAVFRLVLLSLLALALTRVCEAFSLPQWVGVVAAVLVSAVLFSGFHHVGAGAEPYRTEIFVFRAAAGVVLGLLFVLRGFCVVVYTHAVYDVHWYLTHG